METKENNLIPDDIRANARTTIEQADAQAVIESVMSGKPLDPEVAKRVRERGAKITEEIWRKHGLVDIAVPAIRELRGELPE